MGQATRGSSRKQGYQRIVQGSTGMNGTGSGVSIHLRDEDTRDKDSAGGRELSQDESEMDRDSAGLQLECSGRTQG